MAGIKREIKFEYPTPIATAYGRACSAEERAERAKGFRELFEISIRYAALSGCARVFAGERSDDRLDALKVLGQEKLSLGHWVGVVGALEKVLAQRNEHVLGADLREQRSDLPDCIALFSAVDGFDGTKISLATVFDRMTKLRNMEAHRVGFNLAENVELYRAALEELLEKTAVWRRWQLLLVLATEHRRHGSSAKCHAFRGDTTRELLLVELDDNRTVYNDALYLHDPDSKRWVELSPFLLHKGGKLYFFDGIDRRRRPRYALESEQLDTRTLEEAERHLRERAGFLFTQPAVEPSLDALAPFVQMAAADGVITAPELRFLRGRVQQLVVGMSDAEIDRIVEDAVRRFAPDAHVEWSSPISSATGAERSSPDAAPPAGASVEETSTLPAGEDAGSPSIEESTDPAEQVLALIDREDGLVKKSAICEALSLDAAIATTVLRRLLKMNEVLRIGRRGPNVRYGRPAAVLLQVLEEAESPPRANEILETVELDYYRWRRLVGELLDSGEIVAEGAGRGRTYRLRSQTPVAETSESGSDDSGPSPQTVADWTAPAVDFLRAVAAGVMELGLPFRPTATTADDDLDEIVDRWLTYKWSFSDRHYCFLSVGRKYGDRLSVAWGVASEHTRRDPVFRAVVSDLGAHHAGAEIELGDFTYMFAPEDSLCLISGERVLLPELGDDLASRCAQRVTEVARIVEPVLAKRAGEAVEDAADEAPDVPWTDVALGFLNAVRQRMNVPFEPKSQTTSEELTEVEDGWMQCEWDLDDRHAFFVSVGRKWGWKISIKVGFGSAHARRDPEFRELCAALGAESRGSAIEIGDLTYAFCPEDWLALEAETRLKIVDLTDDDVVSQTTSACQDLMQAVLAAASKIEESSTTAPAPPHADSPAPALDEKPPSAAAPPEVAVDQRVREVPNSDPTDWVQSAREFLRRVRRASETDALPFPSSDVSDPDEEDALQGRWVALQWQVTPKHHMFVTVGRKYGDRVTVAWGFGSSSIRRDPTFRTIMAQWGFDAYGDRQSLAGESFEFVSEDGLRLQASVRTTLEDLERSSRVERTVDALRAFGTWAWPRVDAATAPAEVPTPQ